MADPSRTASVGDGLDGLKRVGLPASAHQRRQANAALYRIVTVRMRWHHPTLDYVGRRTAHGLTKKDIIRCLKRFVAREIYNALIADHRSREALTSAA